MNPVPQRIFLVGMPGSGKSAVARLLARELRWNWVDTDDLVGAHDGRPIHQIFREEGEAYFRALEHRALTQACSSPRVVVSTGGGAVLRAQNRRLMAQSGVVVYLAAGIGTLTDRVVHGRRGIDARPLLAQGDPAENLRMLLAQRGPLYARADWTVHTDALESAQVAAAVAQAWRAFGERWHHRPGRVEEFAEGPDYAEQRERDDEVATTVCHAAGSYPIVVGWGIAGELAGRLDALGLRGRCAVVADQRAWELHGAALEEALRAGGRRVLARTVSGGEPEKTIEQVASVWDWLAEARWERHEPLIAVGGGVVTDLVGFAAATYMRGVPLVQVPTTLLGMTDAAIGGKTAVNHPRAKNLVGAFYQPHLVCCDLSFLRTLPERELRAGWAETIKHGLIRDPECLRICEERADGLLRLDPSLVLDVVRRSVAVKARVVSEDEREAAARAVLNFGHTFGHGLEAALDFSGLLHGEAVAVGMVVAARVGLRLGVTPADVASRVERVVRAFGLPARVPPVAEPERLWASMDLDKKKLDGRRRWVLLTDIGATTVRNDVPDDLVREVAAELSTHREAVGP